MAETSIELATHVWNPTTGCDRVSPGCAHCYALDPAARAKRMGQHKYQSDGRPGSSEAAACERLGLPATPCKLERRPMVVDRLFAS